MTLGVLAYVVIALCILLATGTLFHLVVWAGAALFAARRDPYAARDFAPPVSIVKPVRGLIPGEEENFASFFSIIYPMFEIIFVVHEDAGDDPAIPVIKRLIAENPGVDARLIRSRQRGAAHEKVNNYNEAIALAKYEIINITDADTYVRKDHLSREVRPLSDPEVGMVFSRQTHNRFPSAATAFEGLVQTADYSIFVSFASIMGLTKWVVGHSIFFRKSDYYALDAYSVLKDHLIDDLGWGEVFCGRAGKRMWLSKTTTPTRAGTGSWKKVAGHIVRWGVFFYASTRIYLIIPLIENSALGLLTLVLSLFLPPDVPAPLLPYPLRTLGMAFGAGTLVWRLFSNVTGALLFGDDRRDLRYFWTIPLRDIFSVYVGLAVPFVRRFVHSGREYRIRGRRLELAETRGRPAEEGSRSRPRAASGPSD